LIFATTDHDKPSPELRDAEVSGAQDLRHRCVADRFKFLDEAIENGRMAPSSHSGDVLHHEIPWAQRGNKAEKIENEAIPRVVDQSLPDG
jgi:hypothetical protein